MSGETRKAFQDKLLVELRRECWVQGISISDALVREISPPAEIASLISQREQASQEIDRSTNQMEEAKSEALLVEQQEMQAQNGALGDARRDVVTVTKRAEQREVVSVTQANREHAVAKLANLHLVATERAAERVVRMGELPETVFVTGCPSIDLAARVRQQRGFLNLQDLQKGVGADVDPAQDYVIVLQHPVTIEWQEAEAQMTETLWAMRELDCPAYWFWPNVDAGSDATSKAIRVFRERYPLRTVHFFRSMPPEDFNRLLVDAAAIVGNSSAAIRECAYLGTPAINIGSRQSGRERGPNVTDVEYDRAAIGETLRAQLAHGRYPSSNIYGDGTAGPRIAIELATRPLTLKTPGK